MVSFDILCVVLQHLRKGRTYEGPTSKKNTRTYSKTSQKKQNGDITKETKWTYMTPPPSFCVVVALSLSLSIFVFPSLSLSQSLLLSLSHFVSLFVALSASLLLPHSHYLSFSLLSTRIFFCRLASCRKETHKYEKSSPLHTHTHINMHNTFFREQCGTDPSDCNYYTHTSLIFSVFIARSL